MLSCPDDLDDWYITAILLLQWCGAVQDMSYPHMLPVLIRWPRFLLEKQEERTHVEEILQNAHDICLRNCTAIIILLKSKRRYILGEKCALHINQYHLLGIACLQRDAVEQPLTREQQAEPPHWAVTNQGCTKKNWEKEILLVDKTIRSYSCGFHFILASGTGLFFLCITFCCYCVLFSPMIHLARGHLLKFLIESHLKLCKESHTVQLTPLAVSNSCSFLDWNWVFRWKLPVLLQYESTSCDCHWVLC